MAFIDTAPGPGVRPVAGEAHGSAADVFAVAYPGMVRLAGLILGSQAAAEEVVQDAFLRLHQHWDRVGRPEAYLRRAVVNGSRSAVRRQVVARRHAPRLRPEEAHDPKHDEVWDVIQRLPARQRTAVVLRFYADLPEAEIADAMGCRPATVRSLVHRAIQTMRAEVER